MLGGHPDPEIWGSVSKNNFFLPFGAQFGVKIRGGGDWGRAPRAPSLDLSLSLS